MVQFSCELGDDGRWHVTYRSMLGSDRLGGRYLRQYACATELEARGMARELQAAYDEAR